MTSPTLLPLPPTRTILTPRLRLRTARLSDAQACQSFLCDDETMKYSTTGAVAKGDLGAVEGWLRARVLGGEVFQFLVTLRGGGERVEGEGDGGKEEVVIGMMGSHHWGEVGYLLVPGMFFDLFFIFSGAFVVSLHVGSACRRVSCLWIDRLIEPAATDPITKGHDNPSTHPTSQPTPNQPQPQLQRTDILLLLPHTAHTGKGYATEALRAFIPALFEHMSSMSSSNPSTNPPLPAVNYIQAETDQDNHASQNVLRKCGFEFIERLVGAFDSPVLGVRDTVVYRIARPGTKLLDIGEGEDVGFVPPVQ